MVDELRVVTTLDLKGLMCPLPIFKLNQAIRAIQIGEGIAALATDPGVQNDVPAWCKSSGNELISMERVEEGFHFVIRRAK
jgi:tRNA 2-thiouridine synthesizing protein A